MSESIESCLPAIVSDPLEAACTSRPAPRVRLDVAAALAVTLLLWASAFVGIRYAVREYQPGALALFRNAVTAGAFLLIAALWRRDAFRRPSPADLGRLLFAGVVGISLYQVTLISGERSVDAGTAGFITNSAPIFTALIALFTLREQPGWRGWGGILLGFVGASLLLLSHGAGTRFDAGALLVLVAALAQASSFVAQKPVLSRLSAFAVTAWVAVFGMLFVLPYGPALVHDLPRASWPATLAALYLGIFPAAIGNLTWAYALARLPANRAAATLYLIGPIATLISALLLGERPAPLAFVGGAVVIAGLVLVNTRSRK